MYKGVAMLCVVGPGPQPQLIRVCLMDSIHPTALIPWLVTSKRFARKFHPGIMMVK